MGKRELRKWSDSEKLEIIEEHLSGFSMYGLCKKYTLHSSQIHEWMKKYGIKKNEPVKNQQFTQSNEPATIQALRKELRQLRKELAEEKLRSMAYDKLIEIAEEKFRIEIRKKAGTKQSKR